MKKKVFTLGKERAKEGEEKALLHDVEEWRKKIKSILKLL